MVAGVSAAQRVENGRAYRSHNQPACFACRKRKSRCKLQDRGSPCIMCDVHGTDCVWPSSQAPTDGHQGGPPRKRARRETQAPTERDIVVGDATTMRAGVGQTYMDQVGGLHPSPRPVTLQPAYAPGEERLRDIVQDPGTLSDEEDHNAHVIGPVMANDTEILETYLSIVPEDYRRRRVQTASTQQSRPVMFTTMPKKPLGTRQHQSLASCKCELIEKLLEPFAFDVVVRYLECANKCLPIFEEALFYDMYKGRKDMMSPALLANLYANAMTYWTKSTSRPPSHAPDGRYLWIQAHEALHSETFLSPGTSTVIALILNVSGRPSTSPFNNGGMIGTAVALAHALGLNRDPTAWLISEQEKSMRIRIWWQLMVQDRWCSWSYGTPPQIHSTQYDVPLPTLATVCKSERPGDKDAGEVALALLALSETLGVLLEHVYHLRDTAELTNTRESSMLLENRLSSWQSGLHGQVEEIVRHGTHMRIAGAANLRLSYLATRLLLRRIQLDLNEQSMDRTKDSPSAFHHFQALEAAEDIAWFVQGLDEQQVRGFWLGHNGASLTSAFSFLLRSALQSITSGDSARGNAVLTKAVKMMSHLRSLQAQYAWDLANACITQYGPSVDSLAAMLEDDFGQELLNPQTTLAGSQTDVGSLFAQLPELEPASLDLMFPSLWDIFDS